MAMHNSPYTTWSSAMDLNQATFDLQDYPRTGMNNTFPAFNDSNKCDEILSYLAEPPPQLCFWVKFALGFFLSCLAGLTISGNCLVIAAVLTHNHLKSYTNAFVVSLAISDTLVGGAVMPYAIRQLMWDNHWGHGLILCRIIICLDVTFTTTSIFHLVCLAGDRYLAICRPFQHQKVKKRHVVISIILCWTVPLLISFVPITNEWNLKGIEAIYECIAPPGSDVCIFLVNKAFAFTCSAVAFYIPSAFLVMCNAQIYTAAKRQAKQIRTLEQAIIQNKNKRKAFKHEAKAAKTLGIIMGCFCVCWCPFFIINVIDAIIQYQTPYYLWQVAVWLGYSNSTMNPFLFYFFNRSFRIAFRRILRMKTNHGTVGQCDDLTTAAAGSQGSDINCRYFPAQTNGF
ncbi:5-hydroxytryptamine receptor 4 isoform X2 [Octopus bimaculoides]|nr:5-hydroxytryptamine receptor 4 isoform X2 [Octopus bimaculoides]XP_014770534.1 5-hydroxytryptamine receptor 4 isoform X2 [Octopus bimaculoides]XP_014770535.1 5-hydroxytryptamine receptor 4 isoform X2 [Octopus bimaculoides]XP_052821674.1 5-hydroxytryptamine receptor 4 isoform X2 [Octopus bimaculoides]|eukprot:XP_014770533.1 PREDICTED: 5-hydroxytryptamine receptor 4-like [Octopus bimaculoides]